jgi:hypothetical protein
VGLAQLFKILSFSIESAPSKKKSLMQILQECKYCTYASVQIAFWIKHALPLIDHLTIAIYKLIRGGEIIQCLSIFNISFFKNLNSLLD